MRMDGLQSPLRLETGDVYFLKGDRSFDLVSDEDAKPENATEVFRRAPDKMAMLGSGEEVLYLGGHVALDATRGGLLLDELPPIIHISGSSEDAAGLQWLVRELVGEMRNPRAGMTLSTADLAQLMFVRVLRVYLEAGGTVRAGWLRGLGDVRIAPALQMMHSEPSRPWHLTDLARATGMSRSVFAARFKAAVGIAPVSYLTAWRMRLATEALETGKEPVSQIADGLGYTSASAFSNAFKRVTGAAPKRFQSSVQTAGD